MSPTASDAFGTWVAAPGVMFRIRSIPLRSTLLTSLFAGLVGVTNCTVSRDDLKVDTNIAVGGASFEDLKDKALSILRALFPDLSDGEILEIEASLSLDEVLALKVELDEARKAAIEFSDALFTTAEERVAERTQALASANGGFPTGVEAIGRVCTYDTANARGSVNLSGVFNGKQGVLLTPANLSLRVGGQSRPFTLNCFQVGTSVDVVFLIDITGSMSNVIDSVRDSVVAFVNALEKSGIRGTVSVVTFQDTVGVNTTFQQPAPANNYERSPFFTPVSLSDSAGVEQARAFVNRLEANRGADLTENLAGAIDFARNSVIGYHSNGTPNVIGDGKEDPVGTKPFPKLTSDRQVFVTLTDTTFHGAAASPSNSSLLSPFVPRRTADILGTLHRTNTTVHVSDPSWIDESTDPSGKSVDADYWAEQTGGLGEDRVLGYSLVDLELVVVAKQTGLLDITLDQILQSSCALAFDGPLAASDTIQLGVSLAADAEFSTQLSVARY